MGAAFLALFSGALLTSLIASDLTRMFLILSPVVAVASAQFFAGVIEQRLHVWVWLLVAILAAQGVVAIPNAILGEILNGARPLKLAMLVSASLLALSAIVLLSHRKFRLRLPDAQ